MFYLSVITVGFVINLIKQFHIAFFPEDELGIVHSTIKLHHPI